MIRLSPRRRRALAGKPWYEMTEEERLALLTPDTQDVVVKIMTVLKEQGYDARLGETWRSPEGQKQKFAEGKSSVELPGWHSLGRAFHIIVVNPKTGSVWEAAYPAIGKIASKLGAIWLGSRVLRNKYGQEYRDLAHFEYHPGTTLMMARKQAGYA